MCIHPSSAGAAAFIYVFYHVTNALLQLRFYYSKSTSVTSWKVQSSRQSHVGTSAAFPWIPVLQVLGFRWAVKPGRTWFTALLCTINAAMASIFAGAVCEAYMRGLTTMYTTDTTSSDNARAAKHPSEATSLTLWWLIVAIVAQFCVATTWESVVEYWWHRMMHWGALLCDHAQNTSLNHRS